ncbi:MAG: hypothetical protein QXX12_00495 [Nanopusillaceae archaeon]
MEISLISFLEKGGLLAISVFITYLIIRLEKRVSELFQLINTRIEKIENKIENIEKEYVRKTDLFADISGWRGDLRVLSEKIEKLRNEFYYFKGKFEIESKRKEEI